MGRLHYTNRKVKGIKLGQIVNKDLLKRMPPHAGSKTASRDPTIDLDLSGKTLTDDGFSGVASALVEALSDHSTTRLEELSLRDNELTLNSLEALGPIIRLACNDLRELDLSRNHIRISTTDEVTIWENFLTSFEHCCTLRRLDLTGNALGPRGFEVLLRVYAKENPVDLILPSELEQWEDELQGGSTDHAAQGLRKMSLVSEPEEVGSSASGEISSSKRKSSKLDSKSLDKLGATVAHLDHLPLFATTQGLRSMPYLVVSDTAMTETCALHLSFIVESHHMPGQLLQRVPQARTASQIQQITAYDDSQCRGIIYHTNVQLSNSGLKVLELAEKKRTQHHHNVSETGPELSSDPSKSTELILRTSGSKSTAKAKGRRSMQIGVIDGVGADLDRARSRIQGNTLQDAGPNSNDLWRAALRLLAISRDFTLQRDHQPHPQTSAPVAPKVKSPIVKTLTIPSISKPKTLKPLTPLMVEKDPNQPVNPWNMSFLKKTDVVPPTPNVVPPTSLSPKIETESPKSEAENVSLPRTEKPYRTKLPCGFPEYVWAKILGDVAGARGLLSDSQQASMLHYAIDRSTLGREREALGLTLATQIWRVLEATGCLVYEIDV